MPWTALHKDHKGSAAVEFAVVLPILVIILLGIFDFALLFYNKQVLTNASRELARFAIVEANRDNDADPSIADQMEYIKNFCSDRLINLGGANEMVIEPEFDPSDFSSDYITAILRYDYEHLFFSFFGFGPTTLTGQTVMRSE
jgi:Flp pilus assembly pilin Flp